MKYYILLLIVSFISASFGNKYVAFRLDDIQDYWITDAQQAVINVFKDANLPISVGVISNQFGEDTSIVNYIKSCIQQTSFPIEIANHGWNHEDFASFTESEQVTLLSESKAKTVAQLSPLISDIKTFIPPFDSFNDDTISALQTAGYNTISSDISFYGYDDNGNFCGSSCGDRSYPGSNPLLREYPAGSGTNDLFDQWVISVSESMQMIETQMNRDGFSVVMMHFNWYSSESSDGTTSVNQTMITMLQELIQQCQSAGYTFTTIGKLSEDLANGGSPSASSTSSTSSAPIPAPATTARSTDRHTRTSGVQSSSSSSTSGSLSSSTSSTPSASTSTPAPSISTTGSIAPSSTSSTSSTSSAPGSCVYGSMMCKTSETYQTCTLNGWGPEQSCQVGETCHQTGTFIYCY